MTARSHDAISGLGRSYSLSATQLGAEAPIPELFRPSRTKNTDEIGSQVLCFNKGFSPTVLDPSCTRTVPKPYVIAVSGVTSSEKQIPRNC